MDPQQAIRDLAARQDGVITTGQCRALGLDPAQVLRWCRAGMWRRLSRGTYLVDADLRGGVSRLAEIRAGLLSAGSGSVLVLATAAELHGIAGPVPQRTVQIGLSAGRVRPQRVSDPTIRTHQLTLDPADTTMVRGAPVTTPVRTVADLLLRHDQHTSAAVLGSALRKRLIRADDLATVDCLMAGRRGAARARRWLAVTGSVIADP